MIERSKILPKDRLFRRFEQEDFNEKGLKSSAFSDPVDEPSVHLEKLADFYKIEKTYDETVAYGVFVAGQLRINKFDAEHRPLDEDCSHSVILAPEGKLTKTLRRKLKTLISETIFIKNLP